MSLQPTNLLHFIERALNDAVLGFLALLTVFMMTAPAVFEFSADAETWLYRAELAVIGLFALEYATALLLAADRRAFVLDPWRILDLLIIGSAFVALLPNGPEVLRHSPAFRILRLGRLALLGTRSGLVLKSASGVAATEESTTAELEVVALAGGGNAFIELDWEQGLQRVRSSNPDWLFVNGITQSRLAPIAEALAVPEKAMLGLFQSSVPRFDRLERFSTLFVRYPLPPQDNGRLRRSPLLLVGTADNVVVLCQNAGELLEHVRVRLGSFDEATPRMVRAMLALIAEIFRAYTDVIEAMEQQILSIESTQANLSDEAFLARTFDFRTDILRCRSSLKHLKRVVRDLSQGKLALSGTRSTDWQLFELLADDADDLYEGVEDLRESLQALVDLRLNVSSFQMNRVMRLLALLTALALIPATAGGLLGMNLLDTPWPGTLAQVSFGVAAGMAVSLYVFAVKGWLR